MYHRFLHWPEYDWLFVPVVLDQTILLLVDCYLHYGIWHCNIQAFALVEPSHMEIYSVRSNKFCKTCNI